MGIKQVVKRAASDMLNRYYHAAKQRYEVKKFQDPRRVAIYSQVQLTDEQKQQIDELYVTHYGKKIPYIWHQHFTAYTGKFDPAYIPELLYIPEFEAHINPDRNYINVLADKNILAMIAAGVGVRMPRTIVSCANGILRDGEYHLLKWDDLIESIPDGICFAKPTVDSCSGQGCILVNKSQDGFIDALKTLGKDFVVQERIVCSDSIRTINPSSANTFRIMTYIWNGQIQVAPVVMRIGRNGSHLDNAHAGGMFIAVNPDGTLHESAFTEFRDEFTEHPDTHVVFDGYKIDDFEKVIESSCLMHAAIPQMGVVNWDFTIDENNQPVLIEANTSAGGIWLFQMAWGCGPFGSNTESILSWLKEQNRKCAF